MHAPPSLPPPPPAAPPLPALKAQVSGGGGERDTPGWPRPNKANY